MGIGSAIAKPVGKFIRKQMDDAFGEYSSKAKESVEASDVGRTKPKPAENYISQMRKSGVSEEEISDLGLDELSSTQFTKDEMLAEIETRKAERTGGKVEVIATKPEEVTEDVPGVSKVLSTSSEDVEMKGFKDYVPEIGSPSTYEMLTYHKPDYPGLDIQPVHGKAKNQLFHLRVNQGLTEDGDKVTNLLELQSDVGQPIARGESPELVGMPFVNKGNWELLGMKEAIKHAKAKGSRYLAIAPGEEVAMSVGNRVKTDIDVPVRIVRTEPDATTGKTSYTFETPEGYELDPRPLLSDYSKFNIKKNELIDKINTEEWKDLLSDLGMEDTLRRMFPDDMPEEDFLKQSAWLAHKASMHESLLQINKDAADVFAKTFKLPEQLKSMGRHLNTAMNDVAEQYPEKYGDSVWNDSSAFIDVASENVWSQEFIDLVDAIEWDKVAEIKAEKFHPKLTQSEVGKYLGVDPKKVDELADTDQEFILPAGQHGGEGIVKFYDEILPGKKRVKKYKAPLVKIKVDRPDGTYVEVNALDLKDLPDDPKDIPYTLYALAVANVGGIANKVTEMNQAENAPVQSEPEQMELAFADGGFVGEDDMEQESPAGSLNEEVADDIDAKLSEGEYVFPADVVRFIGLDKLEQIHSQAKQGLQDMEDRGRIGNSDTAPLTEDAPQTSLDEAGDIEDELVFTPTLNFASGGAAIPGSPQFLGQKTPEYLKPKSIYTAPKFTGADQQSTQSVYQKGAFKTVGDRVFVEPKNLNTTTQPSTTTAQPAEAAKPFEIKKFANAQGSTVYIPFMNGKAQQPIPEGYKEVSRFEDVNKVVEEAKKEQDPTDVKPETTAVMEGDSGSDVSNDMNNTVSDAMAWSAQYGNQVTQDAAKDYSKASVKGAFGILGALANPTNAMSVFRGVKAYDDIKSAEMAFLNTTPYGETANTFGLSPTSQQTQQLTNQVWSKDPDLNMFESVAQQEAYDVSVGNTSLSQSSFASMGEAEAVAEFGWASDEHFAAIDNDFANLSSSADDAAKAEAEAFDRASFDSISAGNVGGDAGNAGDFSSSDGDADAGFSGPF